MTADISVAELVRCGAALVLVLGGASVLGAMMLTLVDDDRPRGLRVAVLAPVVAIVLLVFAVQQELL